MPAQKKKVLLIDGNSFCYRAFYAIKSLTTSRGEPTNAIYGFVTMLHKLMAEHHPQYLAVAFDLKGPTFRHKRFADYKIHRPPMPDELSRQLPIIKEILQAYRISVFEKEGYEADDLIATLAKRLARAKLEILIVTGDKDILQIVNDTIKVINPHRDNLILDGRWVEKRYGVSPEKIIEIMALAGDATDNIPGVPGIGEATATALIKRFGTLEEVLANVHKITPKTRTRLKEFAAQARMSRELAKLDWEVEQVAQGEIAQILNRLEVREADQKRLLAIFKELEFKTLIQKMTPPSQEKLTYQFVSSPEEAHQALKKLSRLDPLSISLACTHPHPMRAKISGIALAQAEGRYLYFSFSGIKPEILKPVLEDEGIKKIGHNLKYARVVLANYGINLGGISFDTMIAAYLLEPARLKYELADLALEYLNYKFACRGNQGGEETFAQLSAREEAELCCQRVKLIFRLSEILQRQLRQKNLFNLFQDIEIPLISVLADMEQEGVALDRDLLSDLADEFATRLKRLTAEIYEMAGESFNIQSPQQLSYILFEKLGLSRLKRTKTGSSTDTEVLQRLSSVHPIANSLLEFRELSKLQSTYVQGMRKLIHPRTGKIHTSFNQAGTATGRLSSRQPNLQNIPIKTTLGKKIRQIFIPAGSDHLLLSADYSQIELRILAHLSSDNNLISAFREDLDIHTYTASLIFGCSSNKITAPMRDTAKTVNFGIIYGMSAYGLAKDLGTTQAQAQEFITAYFQRYPGVKNYIHRQIEKAKRQGFVTTLLKRRRYIPQINSPDENVKRFAQRVAINAPVQGSASDLIKAAMVEIHRSLKAQAISARLIIQVHDELVLDVPARELERVRILVKEKMENVIKLKVPIKVSIKVGKNWLEME